MSNNIPEKGKQRKHDQDSNSNAMPMGGAMPSNSAASSPFATPIISQPHAHAAPDYDRSHYGGVEVQHLQQPPVSGSQHPMMVVPGGMNVQQVVKDLKTKEEELSRKWEQLKGTIGEMEKEREEEETELSRLREVEKKNGEMMKQIGKLMKDKAEAWEKAYNALLEKDKFYANIAKMKKEEEDRIKEEEWNATLLRSEITACTRDKERAEEELRNARQEIEDERKNMEKIVKELKSRLETEEKGRKDAQFILKNEKKKLKGIESDMKKNEELKKQHEEVKSELKRLKREHANLINTVRENMETVVKKKKELEMEVEKRDKMIDRLNVDITRMRENWNETSMTTIKDGRRGRLVPRRTLMDFDEEPTQLYSKSNLSTMKEKEFIEVNESENTRGMMERIAVEKENDTMYMMRPANDRRQLAPMDSKKRILGIANRNAKTLPHLRSSHTVEQLSPNFSQEALRDGVVRPSSSKKSGVFSRLGMKNLEKRGRSPPPIPRDLLISLV